MSNRVMYLGALLLLAGAGSAWAVPEKCGGADIANGPFSYIATGLTQATFSGSGGSDVSSSFNVAAPNASPDTSAQNVFPGQGATNACAPTANALIGVLEIQKVADADGNPLASPLDVGLGSSLGQAIVAAFSVDPSAWNDFAPGASTSVVVTVSNPNLDSANYGDYAIKLAAKADGYGIGVGSGVMFTLVLRAPTSVDTTPPVVNVTKPTGDEILGVVGVEVQAYDPAGPAATGLASLSAKVSSVGGAVSDETISLTLDTALTAAPGVTVTGTGSFTPTGGTGADGTSDVSAFTSASRSGIGSYTITAEAVDGAGNTATNTKNFAVNYAVAFTKQDGSTTGVCAGYSTQPGRAGCSGQFKFTVKRSNMTSDGAFMFDKTVEVDLVRTSDNQVVATHVYGTGSINTNTQIDSSALVYQTNFKRGDLYTTVPNTPSTYKTKIYFKDVDGNDVLQGTSNDVTF